jgi:hypothetical protein
LAGGGGTAWYALILVSNDEIGARAMVRKVSAAVIVSLGVALVPMANQARAGSARALLPVGAWGSTGGLSVGPYDGLSGLYDGLNLGPYSGPYTGLYVDVNRFTCTRYSLGLGTSQSSRAATRAGSARAELCSADGDGSGERRKDQTITMVHC